MPWEFIYNFSILKHIKLVFLSEKVQFNQNLLNAKLTMAYP